MSLINDALKKAQKDREAPPAQQPAQYTQTRPGNPAAQSNFIVMKYLVGGALLFAGLVAAVSFMVVLISKEEAPVAAEQPIEEVEVSFNPNAQRPVQTSPAPAVEVAVSAPVVPASPEPVVVEAPAPVVTPPVIKEPEPVVPSQSAPTVENALEVIEVAVADSVQKAPEPVVVTPVAPVEKELMEAVLNEPVAAVESATTEAEPVILEPVMPATPEPEEPVILDPAAPPVAAAPEEAKPEDTKKPDPYIIAFLNASRITGIRIAGSHSKVLMNNQVFYKNSVVEPKTKLRITDILPKEIRFVDGTGLKYRKQF